MTLGAVGLLQVVPLVPFVGLDPEAVGYLKGTLHPAPNLDAWLGMGGRYFSPFGLSVSLLFWCRVVSLLVSGGKPYAERGTVNRISFFVYLILSALQGFGLVLFLESLNDNSLLGAGVPYSGWSFRVIGLLSILAAQSIVWQAAAWISRQGVVQGPAVLFAVEIVYRIADWGYRAALAGAEGGLSFLNAAPLICTVAAVTVLLVGGALLFPRRLPVRLTSRITVYTAADGVALAVLVGTFSLPQESIVSLLSGLLGIFGTIPQSPFLFLMLMTLPFSVKGLLVWRKRVGAVSVRAGFLVLPLLFLLITGGAAALGFREGGGFERMFGRGLFDGNQTIRITLRSTRPSPGDLERIHRRLEALKIAHSVASFEEASLLTLNDVSPLGRDFADLFAQGRLRFSLVSADQSAIDPDRAPLDTAQLEALGLKIFKEQDSATGRFISSYHGPSPESLAPLLELSEGLPDVDGMVQCQSVLDGEQECRVFLVEKEAVIENRHIKQVLRIRDRNGIALLKLLFTDEGRERFRVATGQNIRRQLAVALDGTIYSAPVIMDEISGGSVQLRLPDSGHAGEQSDRNAARLEAVLNFGPLDAHWEVDSHWGQNHL